MATRRSESPPAKRQPRAAASVAQASSVPPAPAPRARKTPRSASAAAAKPAAAGAAPGTADKTDKADSLWRAGLRAIDNVRHDVQRRQANVIETLLGIGAAPGVDPRLGLHGLPGLDAFGLRKFEDVFDQRVAAALERLGMPTRAELQALHDKLDRVLAQLDRLEHRGREAAAPEAAATPRGRGKAR